MEGSGIAVPSSDAASRDALNGTAVERFEDVRAHAKTTRILHNREHFSIFSDLYTEEVEALDSLHCSPVDVECSSLPHFL
jgi:hypothetical protein